MESSSVSPSDLPDVTAGDNGNWTEDPYYIEFSPYYTVLNTVYYAILGPVAIIGNILSVAVSQRILRFRKSIPDMLTGSLAAVDLLCVVSTHTPAVISMAEGQWTGGIQVCSYQYFMAWSCLKTSFFIIILLTVDRYLALVKPFYYRANVTMRQMKISLFALTLFSFGSTSVTIIWFSDQITLLPNWYLCMNTWGKGNEYYSYILTFYGLTFVVGVVIFNVCNTGIVCSLIRHKKMSDGMKLRVVSAAQDRRERRVAKVIETLSVVFMLFWVPYLVFIVLHQSNVFYSEFAEDFAIRILFANTLLNPVIYGVFNRTYRQAFVYFARKILYLALCKKIKKPKERKIFYLRRSYLQHRYARKTHSHGRNAASENGPNLLQNDLLAATTNGTPGTDAADMMPGLGLTLALDNMGFALDPEEGIIDESPDRITPEMEIFALSQDVAFRLNGGSPGRDGESRVGHDVARKNGHVVFTSEPSANQNTESTWL